MFQHVTLAREPHNVVGDKHKNRQSGIRSSHEQAPKRSAVSPHTIAALTQVNRELRKRVYKLHNLVEVSFQLNASLDERKILHAYLLNLFGLISTKNIVILLSEAPLSLRFKPYYYQGMSRSQAETLSIEHNDVFLDALAGNRDVFVIDENVAPCHSPYVAKLQAAQARMVVPVCHRNKMLGLAVIGERFDGQCYSTLEVEIFSLLTNFLGVALANARIYKEMERVSLTDPLTGLFNRRYFENSLRNEVARARRFNHPLSLVMLDVDHFKNYNDRLGHSNGDLLLKDLASVLSRTIRSSDTIARYGGEEFCVLLPEITREGAIQFSKRLRNIINDHPFEKRDVQPDGCITASMGVATYPHDARKGSELLDKADAAMYRAKHRGRNQVAPYHAQGRELHN
jgi:diguanylate cyclase (GGDEF)-like protein